MSLRLTVTRNLENWNEKRNNLMQYLVTMSIDESSPGVDSRLRKIIQAEMIISQSPKEIKLALLPIYFVNVLVRILLRSC